MSKMSRLIERLRGEEPGMPEWWTIRQIDRTTVRARGRVAEVSSKVILANTYAGDRNTASVVRGVNIPVQPTESTSKTR